eukprot:RCo012104
MQPQWLPWPCGLLDFLDSYRVALLLSTCLALLAVDFAVFPRRFSKTEGFGYSVMDLGAGSFVFSNALVYGGLKMGRDGPGPALWRQLSPALPLLVMGAVRLVSLKRLGYPEVHSEYGVHWNFFFTLATMPVLLVC